MPRNPAMPENAVSAGKTWNAAKKRADSNVVFIGKSQAP